MKAHSLHLATGAVLAAALCLLGCVSTPGNSSNGAAPPAAARQTAALPGTPACFFLINFIGSWTVLSDRELIVYAPLYNNPYYIKLFEPVANLKFDQRLGFMDIERTGMICDNTQDDLLVPNWVPHNIPIVAVRRLTVPEARQLLLAHNIKPPPTGKPPRGNQTSNQAAHG